MSAGKDYSDFASDYLADFGVRYNGKATCAWGDGCSNPARWMPVVEFRAPLGSGNDDAVLPVGLLGLGVCDEHRPEITLRSVDAGEKGLLGIAQKMCEKVGKVPPDGSRTTLAWAQVAKEA